VRLVLYVSMYEFVLIAVKNLNMNLEMQLAQSFKIGFVENCLQHV
jgi:hypothetical protein